MFERSAYLYDAYYHFPDYAAASRNLRTLIQQFNPNAKTLLDVACGTGKHLELLRDHYCVESLDINPDLLEIARKRCPEILFHQGNMVDFSLGRRFDVVTYLFCSISYVKTIENAELAVGCMARHLLDGGILIVEPWISPGKCWAKKMSAEITDEPELKIVRMFVHKVQSCVSVYDNYYLVGTPQGVTYFKELEELGLFNHAEYVISLDKAARKTFHDDKGLFPEHNYGVYIEVNNRPD